MHNDFELLRAFIVKSVHIMSVQIRSDEVFLSKSLLRGIQSVLSVNSEFMVAFNLSAAAKTP